MSITGSIDRFVKNPYAPVEFTHAEFGVVRVVIRNGKPWFVANDVATALGYAVPKDAVAAHCKYAEILKGGESAPLTSSPRGIAVIPESDVYRLIMRSNLPSAEDFRDWVCEEVLPTIRKTGSYSLDDAKDWKKLRLKGKAKRKELTDVIKSCGAPGPQIYAAATAIVHRAWAAMVPSKHKEFKHLGKGDNLRDHCTCAELSMISIAEDIHRHKMLNVGATTADDVLQTARESAGPIHQISEIYQAAIGCPIVSSLNNLPGSEHKALEQ